MSSLTITNLPDDLCDRLQSAAERNHRSLNSEVIHRLELSLGQSATDPVALIEQARELRERTRLPYLSTAELADAREKGRA